MPASSTSSDYSAPRANSFPEVTNLFCRLPLLAFSHRPEATHLGDQLRISVRRRVNIKTTHSDFQGPTATDRIAQEKHYSSEPQSISRAKLIPCSNVSLARKDNSSRCNRKLLRVPLRYRSVYRSTLATSTRENINSLPFRPREQYQGITLLSLHHSAVA